MKYAICTQRTSFRSTNLSNVVVFFFFFFFFQSYLTRTVFKNASFISNCVIFHGIFHFFFLHPPQMCSTHVRTFHFAPVLSPLYFFEVYSARFCQRFTPPGGYIFGIFFLFCSPPPVGGSVRPFLLSQTTFFCKNPRKTRKNTPKHPQTPKKSPKTTKNTLLSTISYLFLIFLVFFPAFSAFFLEIYPLILPIESLYCSLRQHSDQRLLIHRTGVFAVKGCTIFRKFPQLCLCEEMKHFSVVLSSCYFWVLCMDLPLWCALVCAAASSSLERDGTQPRL